MALNGLYRADVPLSNYSLTHWIQRITFAADGAETNAACKSSFKRSANYMLYAARRTHTQHNSERHNTFPTRLAAAKVITITSANQTILYINA